MTKLQENYKETMSHWPSGVAIVTSHYKTKDYGMTVSSFTSVSLHPPMISVCIDKQAQMCELFKASKSFAINILDFSQINLAKTFADHNLSNQERFKKHNFSTDNSQNPILEDSLGWLECDLHSFHDTGDHIIYVGEVKKAKTFKFGGNKTHDPLIFYLRGWHEINLNSLS